MEKLSRFRQLLIARDAMALEVVGELQVARSTLSRWRRGVLTPSVPTALRLQAGFAKRGVALALEDFFPPAL